MIDAATPVPKTDFKKALPELYAPKNQQWQPVTVPPLNFLMVDGAGDPNRSEEYQQAVQLLYGASYAVKFHSKRELQRDYVVLPLEGLWHADDMSVFEAGDKGAYRWTMMSMQPEWLGASDIEAALVATRKKKPELSLEKLRFEEYVEGDALQLLHIGSYDDEAPKLAQLHHQLMPQQGLEFGGLHHEIYLGDPRKVAADRLKTILRQPVRPALKG